MQVRPPTAVNVFKATQGSDLDSMYVPLAPEHTLFFAAQHSYRLADGMRFFSCPVLRLSPLVIYIYI